MLEHDLTISSEISSLILTSCSSRLNHAAGRSIGARTNGNACTIIRWESQQVSYPQCYYCICCDRHRGRGGHAYVRYVKHESVHSRVLPRRRLRYSILLDPLARHSIPYKRTSESYSTLPDESPGNPHPNRDHYHWSHRAERPTSPSNGACSPVGVSRAWLM